MVKEVKKKISLEEDESEEDKDKRIYDYAKKLKQQFKIDLTTKRISFTEFSIKMDKIERFIKYYESKYNI